MYSKYFVILSTFLKTIKGLYTKVGTLTTFDWLH